MGETIQYAVIPGICVTQLTSYCQMILLRSIYRTPVKKIHVGSERFSISVRIASAYLQTCECGRIQWLRHRMLEMIGLSCFHNALFQYCTRSLYGALHTSRVATFALYLHEFPNHDRHGACIWASRVAFQASIGGRILRVRRRTRSARMSCEVLLQSMSDAAIISPSALPLVHSRYLRPLATKVTSPCCRDND